MISNRDLRSPILTLGSTTFLHIRHNDLWLVVVTRSNSDAAVIFEWLYEFKEILVGYFGETGLCEELAKKYFDVIYSLIDEVLEFGIPQNMDLAQLKNVVKVPPGLNEKGASDAKNVTGKSVKRGSKSFNYDNEVPWREPGLKYRRNEIFLDVIEKLNVLISTDGKILKSYVDGNIQMKTHLSGMPRCDFGLNDSLNMKTGSHDFLAEYDVKNIKAIPNSASSNGVLLEDCKFHQCVQLDKFDSDRVIQFIPPDGEFELMTYRALDNINYPFKLTPSISDIGHNTLELKITLKSLFPAKLIANDVVVKIPTHQSTIDVSFASSGGKSKFSAKDTALFWTFKKLHGLTEHTLTATIQCASSMVEPLDLTRWSRPPVTLDFELLMFSVSGIVVKHLGVNEPTTRYNTIKWVRYITRGGSYEVRY